MTHPTCRTGISDKTGLSDKRSVGHPLNIRVPTLGDKWNLRWGVSLHLIPYLLYPTDILLKQSKEPTGSFKSVCYTYSNFHTIHIIFPSPLAFIHLSLMPVQFENINFYIAVVRASKCSNNLEYVLTSHKHAIISKYSHGGNLNYVN